MTTSLALKCRCGAVCGEALDPRRSLRMVCYCDDCGAYAHALERPDLLDDNGGTDIWQTAQARLRLTAGHEQVRCLRLSDKGMFRWHTACCRTPIGNTLSPRLPFVGVITAFIDLSPPARDDVLGPPRAWVQGRFATGVVPAHVHQTAPLGAIGRAAWRLIEGLITGAHQPSPFVVDGDRPLCEPRVLSVVERDALRPASR